MLELKVPGPKGVAELRAFVAFHANPVMPSDDEIENVVAALAAVLPRRKEDGATAAAKTETYCRALADVPIADLTAGRDWLMLNTQWFPTIYEIRKAAGRFGGPRAAKVARARILILRHEEEWREPVKALEPGDFARLREEIGVNLACDGSGRRRDGSGDDQ